MKLKDYLDTELLVAHCNNRVINVQHHHYAPLTIYNYGQKAQFEGLWDDVVCKCRGLIIDESTQEIVARPFLKFFNLGHMGRPETAWENLPSSVPEITTKLDGSLGILYRVGSMSAIATRGSFASDQAAWASAWYSKHLAGADWPIGWTPLFEIIYPDNRIVVKYETEGLFLLALVNIETGEEMAHSDLKNLAVANKAILVSKLDITLEQARIDNEPNAEGYVATWRRDGAPPLKIKIKFVEYCRLHRLLTSISPKEIWRMLKDGESFAELFNDTPSHYQEWVNYWKNGLQSEFGRIEQKAKAIWEQRPKDADRKGMAEFFTLGDRKSVSAIMFKMLDGKPYDEIVWKLCRDKTRDQEPFRREE